MTPLTRQLPIFCTHETLPNMTTLCKDIFFIYFLSPLGTFCTYQKYSTLTGHISYSPVNFQQWPDKFDTWHHSLASPLTYLTLSPVVWHFSVSPETCCISSHVSLIFYRHLTLSGSWHCPYLLEFNPSFTLTDHMHSLPNVSPGTWHLPWHLSLSSDTFPHWTDTSHEHLILSILTLKLNHLPESFQIHLISITCILHLVTLV